MKPKHLFGTLALLFALQMNGQSTPRTTDIPIRGFGALSGPVQSFGTNSRAALNAASEQIDKTGGVRLADGTIGHFQITYSDDKCNPEVALAILKESAASDALVAIGPSCSSVAESLFGHLQSRAGDPSDTRLQMPVFTDSATKANLARLSEWAFRNSPNERDMYRSLWQYVRTSHPRLHSVFVGEEADFAHSHSTLQNIIRVEAEQSGFAIEGGTKWSLNDTAFAEPARQIRDAHADVVVISAHAKTTCGVLKELKHLRYHPKLFVGLTSASTPETLKLCGAAAEGLLIPTSFIADSPETRREASLVENQGGIADLHSMAAWEILFTLKGVIEAANIVPAPAALQRNRETLRQQLAQLTTMQGVMGPIRRTPDRESLKPFVLVQARGGKWKVVSDARKD